MKVDVDAVEVDLWFPGPPLVIYTNKGIIL